MYGLQFFRPVFPLVYFYCLSTTRILSRARVSPASDRHLIFLLRVGDSFAEVYSHFCYTQNVQRLSFQPLNSGFPPFRSASFRCDASIRRGAMEFRTWTESKTNLEAEDGGVGQFVSQELHFQQPHAIIEDVGFEGQVLEETCGDDMLDPEPIYYIPQEQVEASTVTVTEFPQQHQQQQDQLLQLQRRRITFEDVYLSFPPIAQQRVPEPAVEVAVAETTTSRDPTYGNSSNREPTYGNNNNNNTYADGVFHGEFQQAQDYVDVAIPFSAEDHHHLTEEGGTEVISSGGVSGSGFISAADDNLATSNFPYHHRQQQQQDTRH